MRDTKNIRNIIKEKYLKVKRNTREVVAGVKKREIDLHPLEM